MSLVSQVAALATRVVQEFNSLRSEVPRLDALGGTPVAPKESSLWWDVTSQALKFFTSSAGGAGLYRYVGSMPAVGLRGSGVQTLTTASTWYLLAVGTIDHNSSLTDFSPVSSVITVQRTGIYRIHATAGFDANTAGRRILEIESFVSQALGSGIQLARAEAAGAYTTAQAFPVLHVYTQVQLTAGTKIRAIVFASGAAGLTINNSPASQLNISMVRG